MIVDLERFLVAEEPYWIELESMLDGLTDNGGRDLLLDDAKRLHYLYQRASSDLAKLADFPADPGVRSGLSALVSRAYSEIHETRARRQRFRPLVWFLRTFPQTFRRHGQAFALSLTITLLGSAFGAGALYFDPGVKPALLPFPHLLGDPSDRVREEEERSEDRMSGARSAFSAQLMTHNTKVAILTMSLGMTWAIGTIMILFYNGVILGAVCLDYVAAGELKFLAGWLLPHGAIEIPAILIGGQAGLVLGKALVGWGDVADLRSRLRAVRGDLVTLIFGVAALLIWAGLVESFFSQYHEPTLPYWLKISFGLGELCLLFLFLWRSGRESEPTDGAAEVVDG